jgi:gamma-glutamyltranspeptidase/glutathione hydrolase
MPTSAPFRRFTLMLLASAIGLSAAPTLCAAKTQDGRAVALETVAPHAMVAAANPLAVAAGVKVLKAGGSAADAAVAVQAVLGLVEPQSSGLGGGAFMLYYDAKTRTTTVYNGRETAPAGASATMFEGPDGQPLNHFVGVLSGRSIGVIGAIATLAEAQKDHGRLPWHALFGDAEHLAENGFTISPRLSDESAFFLKLGKTPDAAAFFTKPDGTTYKTGDIFKNPAYAATIRRLAKEGTSALYKGEIAEAMVAKAHEEPRPGTLSLADLAAYHPTKDEPLCLPYHAYVVCAPPAPGGGLGVLEILGILEHSDIGKRGPKDPEAWAEFVEASRLAYADRDHYVGDPKFVHVPSKGLLDPAYDAARAGLMSTDGLAPGAPSFGTPPGATAAGPDHTPEPGGTSDFAIVDAEGDVVSITTTVESVFGSGRTTHGFFLNNQLTDFSFSPTDPDGAPAANAVAPGKRPRSSMSPVIVFDRLPNGKPGRFVMALGSPGGNSIIAYVAKALVGMIDWKLSPEAAFALPNIVARGSTVAVEKGADPAIAAALKAHGLNVQTDQGEESGLHAVVRTAHGYVGAADPRREGTSVGY